MKNESGAFQPKERKESERAVESVVTAKGSVYNYLEDGTTQRFKTTENKHYEPQSALVFVPDYETLKRIAPNDFDIEKVLGENQIQSDQRMLEYTRGKGFKNYIVNAEGKKLETNQEINNEQGPIFLTFGNKNHVDFAIPVSRKPKLGFKTFDTRKYKDQESGETKRESHLGNPVIEINYKD